MACCRTAVTSAGCIRRKVVTPDGRQTVAEETAGAPAAAGSKETPGPQQTLGSVAIFAAQIGGELDSAGIYGYFLNLVSRSRCGLHIFVHAACVTYYVFSLWNGQLSALHVRRVFLAALSLSYNLLSDTGAETGTWTGVVDDSLSELELARLQQWILTVIGWNIHLLSSDVSRIWASIFEGSRSL